MKNLLSIVIILMIAFTASALTMDEIFKKYASAPGAEIKNIDSTLLGNITNIEHNIKSIQIVSIDKCPAETIKDLTTDIKEINDSAYTLLTNVKKKNELATIMMKKDGDKITDFVILGIQSNNVALIKLKGEMTEKDLKNFNIH